MFDYESKSKKQLLEENNLELSKFNTWSRKKYIKESLLGLGLGALLLKNYLTKKSQMNSAFQDEMNAYATKHGAVPHGVAYDAALKRARQEGEARYAEKTFAPKDEFLGRVMNAFRPAPAALRAHKTGNFRFPDTEGIHPSELGKSRGTFRQSVKKFVKDKLDPNHPTLSRIARQYGPLVADVIYKIAAQGKTSMAGTRAHEGRKTLKSFNKLMDPLRNVTSFNQADPYTYSPGISSGSSFADKMADRSARRARMGLKPLVNPE